MAISDDGKRGQIGPSLRGLIYQYERDGLWVTSKWPKKRGKVATTRQKQAQQAFKDCMTAMKMTAAPIQLFHRVAANGTPMLPRDTLMAALYGNGPTIPFYDGRVIKPMRNKVLSSTVLDALGWEPGTMLFRGPEYWEALPPGTDGQVLAYDADTKAPLWIDPSSGTGVPPSVWTVRGQNSYATINIIGIPYEFYEQYTLNAITWCTRIDDGYKFYAGVAFVDANHVVQSIPVPIFEAGTGTGDYQNIRAQLPTPLVVPAGQRVVPFVQYSLTGLGASPVVVTAWSYGSNIPIKFLPGAYRINTIDLQPGDTFTYASDTIPFIGVEFL